jgi:hypothetical protein
MPQGISMADAATKQIGMQLHIAGRCQKAIHGTDDFGYRDRPQHQYAEKR